MGQYDVSKLPLSAAIRSSFPHSELLEYALVDAFTDKVFKGNPAAVVLLPHAKEERWMQQIAAEFNVSLTAFLVRKCATSFRGAGEGHEDEKLNAGGDAYLRAGENSVSGPKSVENEYHIRWFTPTREVPLCGHATLASSHVLFTTGLVGGDTVVFHSKSGELLVQKLEAITSHQQKQTLHDGGQISAHRLELNFPATATTACDKSEIIKSLSTTLRGEEVISVRRTIFGHLIVEISSSQGVENLQPRMEELMQCSGHGFFVTAKDSSQSDIDFVSRCFFPEFDINEDPVCGFAHTALTPYWAAKLGKDTLEAYQFAYNMCLLAEYDARVGSESNAIQGNHWELGVDCNDLTPWETLKSGGTLGILELHLLHLDSKRAQRALESVSRRVGEQPTCNSWC